MINNQSNFNESISDDKCIYSNIEKVDEESILYENESNELSSPTNLPNQSQNYIKTFNNTHNSNIKCNWCLYECDNDNILNSLYY